MKRPPRVWLMANVGQPFVWGLLRGDIYLPDSFVQIESCEHRRHVLAHEISHVLRFDAAVNSLQVLAQALFWFHPLVWWANQRIRREREKCCDEMAIAHLGAKPKDYSTAILDTLIEAQKSTRPVPSLAVAGPVKNIEERIRAMLKPGKKFYRRPSLTAAVTLLLVAFLIGPTAIVLTGPAQARGATAGGEKRAQTLHEAAATGDVDQVKLLISKSADVNEKDKAGRTPLHSAAWYGRRDVAEVLLAKGANINETDVSGQTPLHLAASFGTKFVPELLLAKGANINARDNAGNTPLHITAGERFNRGDLLELLIAKGADLKARNEAGQTPLHYGARKGGGVALSLLIDHGADISANDDLLTWACTHGRTDIAELLVKKGANVNCKLWGNALTLEVIFSGPSYHRAKSMDAPKVLAILRLLLEHGADPNAGDRWDWSLLHYACGTGTDLPRLLLDKGANPNAVENEAGLTPLHLAADKGDKEVVELLLSRGAKMNARDYYGRTPLSYAEDLGDKDMFGRPRSTPLTAEAKSAKKEVAEVLRKNAAKG